MARVRLRRLACRGGYSDQEQDLDLRLLSYDAGTHKLFLGHRKEGLQVFDPVSRQVVKTIDGTAARSAKKPAYFLDRMS
jgi:hypothetical protein